MRILILLIIVYVVMRMMFMAMRTITIVTIITMRNTQETIFEDASSKRPIISIGHLSPEFACAQFRTQYYQRPSPMLLELERIRLRWEAFNNNTARLRSNSNTLECVTDLVVRLRQRLDISRYERCQNEPHCTAATTGFVIVHVGRQHVKNRHVKKRNCTFRTGDRGAKKG